MSQVDLRMSAPSASGTNITTATAARNLLVHSRYETLGPKPVPVVVSRSFFQVTRSVDVRRGKLVQQLDDQVELAESHKVTKDIVEKYPVTARPEKSFKHIRHQPISPVVQEAGQVMSNKLLSTQGDISNAISAPSLDGPTQ